MANQARHSTTMQNWREVFQNTINLLLTSQYHQPRTFCSCIPTHSDPITKILLK